jgi:hypothetical protein
MSGRKGNGAACSYVVSDVDCMRQGLGIKTALRGVEEEYL